MALELAGVARRYGDVRAVDGVDLVVAPGRTTALLGPSGCGKSTLLRLVAGLETPDAGTIRLEGRDLARVPPQRRGIGMVFQDFALFPHLDVAGNVAFGLVERRWPRERRDARVHELLDAVGLAGLERRRPHELSGGQQQRVALARALAPQPAVILLDEPFSNLDAALRGSTRDEVRSILKRTGTTAVLVTHDQEEALTFADRIAVMRAGRLEQDGAPEEVYARPRTAFVASFLGRTNLLRGEGLGHVARTPLGELALSRPAQGQVMVSLRPEALSFRPGGHGVPARVLQREFKGHDLTYTCQLLQGEGLRVVVQTGPECGVEVGDTVPLAAAGAAVPLEASRSMARGAG